MRLYRYLNALSIDVVIGAIICTLFFAKLFHTHLPMVVLVTLALAVWSVYTIDHLWDAWRSPLPWLTFRHHLHHQHFRLLMTQLMLALLVGGVLFWFLPESTKTAGFMLAICILIYFLTTPLWSSKPVYHKELLIAIAYSSGVILGPYTLGETQVTTSLILVCCQFAALAFSNLLIFASFDTEIDTKQHFGSISRSIGTRSTRLLIVFLLGLVLATTTFGFFKWYDEELIRQSQWVLALMIIPLATILNWSGYFKQKDRYRMLGDITFFIPLLVL